ncbi:hypothetical protein Tco_1436057 [Tanacetum coccineum]
MSPYFKANKYDRDEIPDPNMTNVDQTEHEEEEYDDEFYEEEEEENIEDEETMYDDEDDEVTKEFYQDVNVNLGNVDTKNADQVHDTQKADEPVKSSSVSSNFTSKLLNLENPSLTDNKIASLMETSDPTPTPTPTTSETTTSLPALLDFASVFKFNEEVFNLEKDVSEIKQVKQYAQALSSIPAIVDRYMDNKLGEAINKAILAHNLDCRQEA